MDVNPLPAVLPTTAHTTHLCSVVDNELQVCHCKRKGKDSKQYTICEINGREYHKHLIHISFLGFSLGCHYLMRTVLRREGLVQIRR